MSAFFAWLKGLFTSSAPATPVIVAPVAASPIAIPAPYAPVALPLYLCDISHWEDVSSWATLKTQVVGVYTKATQGTSFVDPKLAEFIKAANAVGMPFGVYHVLETGKGIQEQVDHFLSTMAKMPRIETRLRDANDFETEVNKAYSSAQNKKAMLEFGDRLNAVNGYPCFQYLNSGDLKAMAFTSAEAGRFVWWIANYMKAATYQTIGSGAVKSPLMWQYTDKAKIPGIGGAGTADHDRLYSSLESILVLSKAPPVTPVVTPQTPAPAGYVSTVLTLAAMKGDHVLALAKRMTELMGAKTPRFVTVFDITQSATARRYHLIDTQAKTVQSITCAVGKGSDPDNDGMATKFSDVSGSNMTSLGVFKYAEASHMSDGRPCVRLDGLEASNAHMRARAILLHPAAAYVSDSRAGRSEGCLAISENHLDWLDKLKDGSFGVIG